MSTTKINFEVDQNLIDIDAASVVFGDPTSTFGVIRKDTNAVVVAAGTPLTKVATGVYEYTFTDPVPGLEYRYYIKSIVDGQTFYYERDYSRADAVLQVSTAYSSSQCLYDKFGQDNILRWAAFSDSEDEDTITTRIQNALEYATNYVNDALRGGPYVLPFSGNCVPSTIRDITCTVAGVRLYEARGIEDFTGEVNRLRVLKMEAELQLSNIHTGRLELAPMTGEFYLNTVCDDVVATGQDALKGWTVA